MIRQNRSGSKKIGMFMEWEIKNLRMESKFKMSSMNGSRIYTGANGTRADFNPKNGGKKNQIFVGEYESESLAKVAIEVARDIYTKTRSIQNIRENVENEIKYMLENE